MTTVVRRLSRIVETPEIRAPRSRPWRGFAVAAGVPTLLTGLHVACYGQWIADDAGITFAYARSLASGAGPVLQAGAQPVEGYSNPAWLAVLVAGRWLGLFDHGGWLGLSDLVLFPKLVSLLCCFGIFAAMFAVASTVTRRPVAVTLAAGTATAAVPSFVIWTTSGLENALFALAVVALAAVLARAAAAGRLLDINTALAAGALAALAAMTRPDGIIYVAAFPLAAALTVQHATVRRTITASLASVAAFAVPASTYLVWRLVTFGDYLPNTARAKEQGLPTLTDLGKPAVLIDYTGWLTVGLAIAVVAVALSRHSPTRTVVAMLLVPLGLAIVSYAMLRPDWMAQHRFATPVWPLAALVVAVSAVHVIGDVSIRRRLVITTLAVIAVVQSLTGFWLSANAFRAEPTVGVCNIAQNTGYTVNGYADILGVRDGSLLAVDGGGTSLTSRLHFVDLSGLADARIARFWEGDDMQGLRDHVFDEVRPTFVRLWVGWAEHDRLALTEDPGLARDYVALWSGPPGGGDWVRRDAVPDPAALAAAQRWGRDAYALIDTRYIGVVPPLWWCGDVLRPTPFRAGTPAASPITQHTP